MAGFDDEVRDDFVEGADGFGERRGLVAEGVESGFYCLGVLDSGGAGCWGGRGEGRGEGRVTFGLEIQLALMAGSASAWLRHSSATSRRWPFLVFFRNRTQALMALGAYVVVGSCFIAGREGEVEGDALAYVEGVRFGGHDWLG